MLRPLAGTLSSMIRESCSCSVAGLGEAHSRHLHVAQRGHPLAPVAVHPGLDPDGPELRSAAAPRDGRGGPHLDLVPVEALYLGLVDRNGGLRASDLLGPLRLFGAGPARELYGSHAQASIGNAGQSRSDPSWLRDLISQRPRVLEWRSPPSVPGVGRGHLPFLPESFGCTVDRLRELVRDDHSPLCRDSAPDLLGTRVWSPGLP